MSQQKPQLTVGELIVELARFPNSLPVSLEGCDCTGICCGVERQGDTLQIRRRGGADHLIGDGYGEDHEYEDSE